ncbi:Uu.00g103240.m01.CDS01 [Anthostomella pinea]|uniref:Uu.00g103240.m01.CDS01 n=1 Tax=Anthostomella pinea TaxID=933095 RepID=A0AAI8VDD6_9PEZI|nr:Uu.00g103240.m01.CDS01 [Anthostomella pinea]
MFSSAASDLVRIPLELFTAVASYLPNCAIKNLRLTCRLIHDRAPLRLNRVFLSPNPRNVEVFRAIADHDGYRTDIVEIIWDDTQLMLNVMDLQCGHPCVTESNHPDLTATKQRLNAQLPLATSWNYYQGLLKQQEERFPALKRITITPAAHGMLYLPTYETPMIRAFQAGFNYPIPRGWPISERQESFPFMSEWAIKPEKDIWRGFNIITSELATTNRDHGITELILDVNHLFTSLNFHIFEEPNTEYNNLVTILRRLGFSRFDLALLSEGQQDEGWSSFRSGYLKRALSEASDIQHFSLQSHVDHFSFHQPCSLDNFVPLRTILPVERWHKLRHFGLVHYLVKQDDLLSLLAALPRSVRSVELGFLTFLGGGNRNYRVHGDGSWRDLCDDMHNNLDWRDRAVGERPTVTVLCEHNALVIPWRYIWIRTAISEFLYGDAKNPFRHPGHTPVLERGEVARTPFIPALGFAHKKDPGVMRRVDGRMRLCYD